MDVTVEPFVDGFKLEVTASWLVGLAACAAVALLIGVPLVMYLWKRAKWKKEQRRRGGGPGASE